MPIRLAKVESKKSDNKNGCPGCEARRILIIVGGSIKPPTFCKINHAQTALPNHPTPTKNAQRNPHTCTPEAMNQSVSLEWLY